MLVKVQVHALVKGGNRYTFRPHPTDPKLCRVSFSQPAPNQNGYINVVASVHEARELYRFLLGRGYEPLGG